MMGMAIRLWHQSFHGPGAAHHFPSEYHFQRCLSCKNYICRECWFPRVWIGCLESLESGLALVDWCWQDFLSSVSVRLEVRKQGQKSQGFGRQKSQGFGRGRPDGCETDTLARMIRQVEGDGCDYRDLATLSVIHTFTCLTTKGRTGLDAVTWSTCQPESLHRDRPGP